jgi:simple sugar transport system substrate-binding protein
MTRRSSTGNATAGTAARTRKGKHMRYIRPAALAIAAASALVFATGCSGGAGMSPTAAGGDGDLSGKKVSLLVYTSPGSEFWSVVTRGAEDAAKRYGVNLNIQYGNDDTVKYNNLIQTATTNKVDAIAVSVPDDNAVTDSVCRAFKTGIPVIAYNTNATAGPVLNCEMGFIGQNFVDAGYTLGKRMIADHQLGSGDLVFAPVELPTATYAVQRFAGLKKALDEVGARAELLGTGVNNADARTKLVQYLLGHRDVKAIAPLGSTPFSEVEAAMQRARVKVPVAGFDLTPQVIKGIQNGTITAAVDQQPYSQGYFAIAQLALNLDYGLYPSSMATGGTGLVDKSSVATVAELAGKVR